MNNSTFKTTELGNKDPPKPFRFNSWARKQLPSNVLLKKRIIKIEMNLTFFSF